MTDISNYERAILDRHVVAQQTLAIWNGVGFALVFSYAGALFTFLIGQPLPVRLLAYLAFAIAYGAVISGTIITGMTMIRHVHELKTLSAENEVTGLSQWIIDTADRFGGFNRHFSQASYVIFLVGLLLATLLPLS